MIYTGSNGNIEVTESALKITRKGIANFFTQGIQGERTIPISSIRAIQFKDAGEIMNGYIQLSVVGSIDRVGGIREATKDENAVLFNPDQQTKFKELKEMLEARIMPSSAPISSGGSVLDDLERLASLRDKGVLNEAEFDEQKQKILSR